MEHKVGDKVKIREDLTEDKRYGDNIAINNMTKYVGRITTIVSGIDNHFGVKLDIDNGVWNWTPEMFDQNWKEDKFMKTSEFKAELEKLGYTFEEGHVYNLSKRAVARVTLDEANVLDTLWGKTISDELFSLLTRYAATPIAEREDEKLFNVQIIKGKWGRASWVYRDYDAVRTSSPADNNDSNQQWTLEQIKEYGIEDEAVYKRVPVGD